MNRGKAEQGFTLVESIVSLFVISVFLGCLFPLIQELRIQSTERAIRTEANHLLQEKMERILASFSVEELKQEERQESRLDPKRSYYLQSEIRLQGENLWEIIVKIRWEESAHTQEKELITHRFVPNKALPMLNGFSP